ncbi:MAG: phosphate signaling complex protein PhoU [Candidatus Scatosoma sp.]
MSIRKLFEEELSDLKTELVEMCRLTETMIETAIQALVTRDRELGKSVGDTDKRVDEYEMDIEKKCMRILLKQQPVAKDFREVSTALKMITDIERFGDQASDIGELVYSMPGDSYVKELHHISKMGELAVKMARESVNSFILHSVPLSDEVIALDDTMDELFLTVKNELIDLIKEDAKNGDQAIELMMVAKYLERIGDHAVNVAEWTKYNETGVHEKF